MKEEELGNEPSEKPEAKWSEEQEADFINYFKHMHASFDAKREAGKKVAIATATFTAIGALLDEPEEQTSWIVEGLLPAGGTSILAAKPKVGKSTAARQVALSVSRGEQFLGRETTKGTVLYVSLEDKRSEVRKHFGLLGATGSENLAIYFGSTPEETHTWLEKEIVARQPILVIIDTLFRFAQVADVNDYAKIIKALDPLLALARNHNVHLMLVHHAGKGGREGADVILGSTAIFGTVDTAIILRRTESNRIVETHQRYGVDLEPTILVFDEAKKSISLGGSKEENDIQKVETAILDFLTAKTDPIDETSIDAEVDGRTGVKRKALRALVHRGEVARTGGGKKGDPFLYSCFPVPGIVSEQEKQSAAVSENVQIAADFSRSADSQK